MKGSREKPGLAGGIIYSNNVLGAYLKIVRQRVGFTLRELERRSGVSDSEIFQVESGSQKCTLESFVRMCAALGVPCGYVLDNVVMADPQPYILTMLASPTWKKVEASFSEAIEAPVDESVMRALAANLGMIAAFAAHLIRCARPSARAKEMSYPTDQLKVSFLQFAEWIESDPAPLERLSVLSALANDPISEMMRLGLAGLETIKSFIDMMVSDDKKGFMGEQLEKLTGMKLPLPVWTPFVPTERFTDALFQSSPTDEGKK